jgi:hypothetical protein
MTLAQWLGLGAGLLAIGFIIVLLQGLKAKRSRGNPEFKAIMREAAVGTAVEFAVTGLLLLALAEAASSLADKLSAALDLEARSATTLILFAVFAAALAFAIWSFSKRGRAWSDHLKKVVPLTDFLQYAPADRILAPNLDENSATALLGNLQAIAARDDVTDVRVGLLPDEGYQSDRVLIKTFASVGVIREWSSLLRTDVQTIATRRYEVNGERRKVRSLLFVWD